MYREFNQERSDLKSHQDEMMSSSSTFSWTLNPLHDKICAEKNRLPPLTIPKIGMIGLECRTVRVFISSTFKDFYNEREILVKKVFPRLRDFCEQRGLFLVECDLRWGVPKDATSIQAISTCLDEIQRSIDEMEGKNFFLGLLGDRYGWAPADSEMSPHIINKYEWISEASVTLMEMIHGAIRTMSPNCLIMYRNGEGLYSEMPTEYAEVFTENKPEIQEKVKMVRDLLKKHFQSTNQFLTYSCQYAGLVKDKISDRNRVHFIGLEEFEQKVCTFIEKSINQSFSLFPLLNSQSDSVQNFDEEQKILLSALLRSAMKSMSLSQDFKELIKNPKSRLFVSMEMEEEAEEAEEEEEEEEKEKKKTILEGNAIVCLEGAAGSGKSTMMAALIKFLLDDNQFAESESRLGINKSASRVFYHFCGASIASKSENNLMQRFQNLIDQQQPHSAKDQQTNTQKSFTNLIEDFGKSHQPHMCFLLIDALDEMLSETNWLPQKPLPSNVCCIISCLDNYSSGKSLRQTIPQSISISLKMPPLSLQQSEAYVNFFFNEFGKTLDSQDLHCLLDHQSAINPLWLSLACEEIRLHGDYASLTNVIQSIPDEISELYKKILQRFIDQDASDLTQTFLQLLFISRAGLWEQEVASLLCHILQLAHVAPITVTDLMRTLKPFIHLVGVPVPIIKLRHRIVAEILRQTVFPNCREENVEEEKLQKEIKNLHLKMADYFQLLIDSRNEIAGGSSSASSNYYHLELVYHRYHAGQRAAVMKELWSPMGMRTFNSFHRSRLLNSLRCAYMKARPMPGGQKASIVLKACQFCFSERRQPFGNCCFYCSSPIMIGGGHCHPAHLCILHESSKHNWDSICALCDRFFHPSMLKPLHLCMLCDGIGTFCSVLVKETDPHFHTTVNYRVDVNSCFSLGD